MRKMRSVFVLCSGLAELVVLGVVCNVVVFFLSAMRKMRSVFVLCSGLAELVVLGVVCNGEIGRNQFVAEVKTIMLLRVKTQEVPNTPINKPCPYP
ncbi:hypothetical protein ABZP36_021387 [Zizania latifolia]